MRTLRFKRVKPSVGTLAICASKLQHYGRCMTATEQHTQLGMIETEARLILVTEAFHLPRAWASFTVMGARDLALYPSERLRQSQRGGRAWGMLLRESLAIWFNAGRFTAWLIGGALGVDDTARAAWLR